MTDTQGEGRQDIDIDSVAKDGVAKTDGEGANDQGTQTQGSETATDGGDTKSDDGAGDGTGTDGDGSGSGDAGDEGDTNPATGKPWTAEEWRDKFRASAKGANELLTKVNTLTGENTASAGKIAELETELTKLRDIAEGKNPEGLKAVDLEKQLKDTSEKLALLTEKGQLDDFEKANPLATGEVRESLKALARANPKTPLQELFDKHLKAGAEAAEAKRKEEDEKRKKGQGDTSKGTSTKELANNTATVVGNKGDTGKTLEEFNALSVSERKQLIEKYDIRM